MLAAKKTSKKRIIIYSIIIVAMIIGNIVIFYGNNGANTIEIDEDFLIAEIDGLSGSPSGTNSSDPNDEILEHNLFNTLKKIGDWPLDPKDVGKADPFAPIVAE